ncbi:secretin N-terminal domain-containing protein, partial [Acidobacteriota bacterium]
MKKQVVSIRAVKVLLIVLVCALMMGCTAEKLYKEGKKASALGRWDDAVRYYAEAVSLKPRAEYRSALTLAKIKASQLHFQIGKRLKETGQLELALVEFREALDLDPTNQYLITETDDLLQIIKNQREREEATPSEIERLKQAAKTPSERYRLNPKSLDAVTLHFAKTKVKEIYTALGKAAGINIIFDDGIRDTEFSIDISGISFRKALDQIVLANRHFYKILDENTIFIIPDNPTKRREYEDHIIKTFYLSNATLNDVIAMLRQILDIRKVGQNPALNSITLKDTPDKVAIAERIIRANDKPPAEVIIDVEILEVLRQKQLQHGTELSSYSISQVLDIGDVTGDEGTSGLRLSQIGDITRDDWILTIPNIKYSLFKSGGMTRFLAKPSLRALDGKQVSLRLGDQVPIETSTFSGTGAQFSTRNFQFRDIGINIDITPRVHHNNEVTLVMRFRFWLEASFTKAS